MQRHHIGPCLRSASYTPRERRSNSTAGRTARHPLLSAGLRMESSYPVGAQETQTRSTALKGRQLCVKSVFSLSTELDEDSRRTLTASGSLILKDVNFGDTAIYQCKASNTHGTILTNTNVYVIGVWCLLFSWRCPSAPSFLLTWLTSLCVLVLYCSQSCPPRSSARMGVCTLS